MIIFRFLLVVAVAVIGMGCQKSGLTDEHRTPGEVAFRSSCQSCHILPKPTLKTDEEWPSLVSRYGEKARLSDASINDIISYLTANN